MSEQDDVPADGAKMSDEQVVSFTQGVRKKLITTITAGGDRMPTDKGEQMVLLAALGDMDRTALGKMKIGAKERQGAADRDAAMAIAHLTTKFGGRNPFEQGNLIEGESVRVATPELDTTDLPALVLVDGETDQGISTQNYEEFMGSMEGSEGSKG
jgi:hypothetical protein